MQTSLLSPESFKTGHMLIQLAYNCIVDRRYSIDCTSTADNVNSINGTHEPELFSPRADELRY